MVRATRLGGARCVSRGRFGNMAKCERCGRESYELAACFGCKRKVGHECEKSAKRLSTHERILICKDCWSKLPRRRAFKSA